MAKKKKSKNINVQLQELANSAMIQVQKLANEATEKSFKYNSTEAATNRDWQKEMSDTSHQREVADLKASGLNPVLSANQGAMSYTSSSANAQANDPSGSVSQIYGNQMNNMANIYQTKLSNAAQLQAAHANAAAMKSAAAASAAAQKYAADRSYAANKYAWQSKMKIEQWKAKNAPQQSIAGLIDKHFSNTGLPSAIEKKIKSFFSGTNINSLFSNFSSKSWKLNSKGVSKVNAALKQMGLSPTASNRRYFVNGLIIGNKNSITYLNRIRSRY